MFFPEEFFTKEMLPYIRIVLAKKLSEKGHSQLRIAKLLGVTQAMVSFYLKKDLESAYSKLREMGIDIDGFKYLVFSIVEESSIDEIFIMRSIRNFFLNQFSSGFICKYHVKKAGLDPNCDICVKSAFAGIENERYKMIQELKKETENLLSSPEFYFLIPEVFSNIAYSFPNPQNLKDVLSFPGRIIKYKNSAKVISEPEFGVSTHLANMLLEANKKKSEIRCCICIKYNSEILKIIKSLGLIYDFNFPKKKSEDPVLDAFKRFLRERELPQVLIDKGGKGLEPICYVFGKNPKDVIDITLKIAKLYFKRLFGI